MTAATKECKGLSRARPHRSAIHPSRGLCRSTIYAKGLSRARPHRSAIHLSHYIIKGRTIGKPQLAEARNLTDNDRASPPGPSSPVKSHAPRYFTSNEGGFGDQDFKLPSSIASSCLGMAWTSWLAFNGFQPDQGSPSHTSWSSDKTSRKLVFETTFGGISRRSESSVSLKEAVVNSVYGNELSTE